MTLLMSVRYIMYPASAEDASRCSDYSCLHEEHGPCASQCLKSSYFVIFIAVTILRSLKSFSRVYEGISTGYNAVGWKPRRGTTVVSGRLTDDDDVSELGPRDVAVRILFAPINPSDINQVDGNYDT